MIINGIEVSDRADLYMLQSSLKGQETKEFVYRSDLLDKLRDIQEKGARIINIREEE